MSLLVGLFLFGCAVTAVVALGLVFAYGALGAEGVEFEGEAAEDEEA